LLCCGNEVNAERKREERDGYEREREKLGVDRVVDSLQIARQWR